MNRSAMPDMTGVSSVSPITKKLLHKVTAFSLLPSVTVYTLPMVTNSGYTVDHCMVTPSNIYTLQKVNKEHLHRTATRQVRKGRRGGKPALFNNKSSSLMKKNTVVKIPF